MSAAISREPEPLVVRLPRQAGQKEVRFAHLLNGAIDVDAQEQPVVAAPKRGGNERIDKLEQDFAMLNTEVEKLRAQLEEFKKLFE